MSILIFFLSGLLTPVFIFFSYGVVIIVRDKRFRKRYAAAWDKFSLEWERLSPASKKAFEQSEASKGRNYLSIRDLYFAKRWNNGQTTEA